jgi:ribosome recycling factor
VAKIAVRNHREETLKALKRAAMSEDEEERLKGEIQKLVDESNEKIVALGAAKTTEVLNLNS